MFIDSTILSRAQFGFTIGFHILFPTLNIGLGLFLAIMEGIYLRTKNDVYLTICKFWTKIFALTFGMGVVSGIVLSYELGTNFGPFINAVGGVLGSLFAYEVLSAFFLEAGFLGVMLFGWNRVNPKVHYMATLLVMIGTTISAFWILSANSWMQTPAGFYIENGRYIVNDWWQVVFNPSFIPRFIHMMFASYVTTCFVVAGVSAWFLLRNQFEPVAKKCFSFALGAALVATFLQILIGDEVGLKVHEYQPLKTAAMEGVWDTQKNAPLILFGIPNTQLEKNEYVISIPDGASLINTHKLDGELIGLKSVPAEMRPNIPMTFWMFRAMVGIGLLLFAIALYANWLRLRGKLYNQKWFYRACVLVAPIGFFASIAGWLTAETGRQPWVVYNMMLTKNGAALVPLNQVATSFILFIVVYGIVFSFYLVYLFKTIRKGPDVLKPETPSQVIEETPFKYLAPEAK